MYHPVCLRTALVTALLTSSLAHASSNILLQYEGGNPAIPGSSVMQNHERQIEATSFQWSVGLGISRADGKAEIGAPSISEIVWTLPLNASYNPLSQALGTGVDTYTSTFSQLKLHCAVSWRSRGRGIHAQTNPQRDNRAMPWRWWLPARRAGAPGLRRDTAAQPGT